MIKNEVAEASTTENPAEQTKPPLALIACTCAFVLCILISVAPLFRLVGIAIHISLGTISRYKYCPEYSGFSLICPWYPPAECLPCHFYLTHQGMLATYSRTW